MKKILLTILFSFLASGVFAAQHDYDIANQTFPSFRSDLNNVLSAIVSHNAGATEPSSKTTNMLWADTTAGVMKQWDGSAWQTIWTLSNGKVDHGNLDGLADDDHTQYHNNTRGDARYFQQSEFLSTSAGAGDSGKPVKLDAAGHIDATMINDGDIDHTAIANIGTNTHAQIDTHIAATSGAHGATGTIVGTSDAQTLTNKTINTASNTITVVEADISDLSHTTDQVGTLTLGDLCANDGSSVNCTVNTMAELETAMDGANIIENTEINLSSKIAGLVTDETGSGKLVFGSAPSLTLPFIAGGTWTAEMLADETGIEFQETDLITDCSSFSTTGGGIFYDDSEGKLKKCQDNVLSDLDTNTGGGSGSMTTTKEGDTPVGGADIVTLDFGPGFDLAESPDTEINITLDLTEKQVNLATEVTGTLPNANVAEDLTITGGSVDNTTTITIEEQGAADPTIDGRIEWDTTTETLKIGDDGVGTKEFFPDAHTTDTTLNLAGAETITGNWVNTANPWADNEVADDITVSNYLPLAGGTLTGELKIATTGIEAQPTDAITDCSSFAATGGGLFYDDSEGKFKKCQDNVLTDLDTSGGETNDLESIATNAGDGEIFVGTGAGTGAYIAGLAACASGSKIEYVPGSPDTFTCESISITESQISDLAHTATAITDGIVDFPDIKFDNTLAGNPALAVDECFWFADLSGGGILCEGSTADTNEQLYRFPDANGADTTQYFVIADNTNVSATEVGYLDGVTSAIQTQINGKEGTLTNEAGLYSALSDVSLFLEDLIDDTTPQLGGALDANGNDIALDDATGIDDENGNQQIIFQTTASAVNEIEITNAATGNAPQIAATGGDTNIDLKLQGKGTGEVIGYRRGFVRSLVASETDVATGTSITGDVRLPFSGTIKSVGCYVTTAGTTGTMTVDIHLGGTTIMTTNKISIETGEKTSEDAATAPALTTTAYTADSILTFDIDAIQTTAAKGLECWMDLEQT